MMNGMSLHPYPKVLPQGVKFPYMGCMLAIGCDSCTHELEFSEVELADMGCVLARGCDSCTHEPEVSETEVADMSCVLEVATAVLRSHVLVWR